MRCIRRHRFQSEQLDRDPVPSRPRKDMPCWQSSDPTMGRTRDVRQSDHTLLTSQTGKIREVDEVVNAKGR
jgi:hypothetical protein